MNPKRIAALVAISVFSLVLIGCSKANSGISDETANITDESAQNEQDNYEKISATSSVNIFNVIEDGTFWAVVTDENGQTKIVHTNIYGDILGSMEKNSVDEAMEAGLNDDLFVVRQDNEYKIYDINSHEEVSATYIGDYDRIISYMKTEDGTVFGVTKEVDSFEEKYISLKLVDEIGKAFFEISLDSSTLMDNYGIEKNYSVDDVNIRYAGNNTYVIKYVAPNFQNALNALVVDLNRNEIIPAHFPPNTGTFLCSSDGNYTIASQNEPVMVDQEAGIQVEFPNSKYVPMQKISEGVFYAEGKYLGDAGKKVFLNLAGEIVIDLNQYPQDVVSVYPFENGAAFIRFRNNYVTYINLKGEFLFEPIKGYDPIYLENTDIAIMYDKSYEESDRAILAVDKKGNTKEVNLMGAVDDIILIEYEDEKYWVADGKNGLQVQKYE